jgi:hypothetical protein
MNAIVPNAASPAEAQQATKPAELKSTDTGVFQKLKADSSPEPKPAVAAKVATPKPEPKAAAPKEPEAKLANKADHDADPAAEHPEERLEPWMRKRLTRAEEKGRKQALAEFSHLLGGQLQPSAQAPVQPLEPPAPQAQPKTLADFDNDIEKYTDYLADVKVEKAFAKREEKAKNEARELTAQEARTAFDKRAKEFEAKSGVTWEDVISAEVDIPQEVVDLISGHPRDLYLGHYLVTNPEELESLRGKSRLEIATRLAEIDRTLSGETQPEPKPTLQPVRSTRELPPKTTKAPPPPAELPSGSSAVKSIANMTTDERIAEWRRQKAARR